MVNVQLEIKIIRSYVHIYEDRVSPFQAYYQSVCPALNMHSKCVCVTMCVHVSQCMSLCVYLCACICARVPLCVCTCVCVCMREREEAGEGGRC